VTGRDGMLFSHPSSVNISALSQMVEDQNGGVVLDGGILYSTMVSILALSINFHMEARMLFGLRWNRRCKKEETCIRHSWFQTTLLTVPKCLYNTHPP